MKIILGTESFSPNISGVAIATQILAENLAKAGHQVWVFCPGPKSECYKDPKFEDFFVWRLESVPNPFRKGFRITFVWQKEIEKMVSKIRPDLIHLQDVASIGNLLLTAGRKACIPVIVTNHFSLEFALSYLKFFKPLFRQGLIKYLANFYDKCDCVVTPTETIAKQVRSWGTKTEVVAKSNGIFFDRFDKELPAKVIEEFKLRFQLPENPIVLYTGRIDKDKSIEVLIRAIPGVLEQINAHFVLAGSGDMVDEMQELAEELKVRNNVTFVGRLDNTKDEFVALYQSASLFAIPSTIETQSLVTLEAMSAGLPVVAANANALPELVINNENGHLFPPGDSKLMAKHIVKILQNKKMARRMGQESKAIASQHHMAKAFGSMLNLYHEIIEDSEARKTIAEEAVLVRNSLPLTKEK